MRWATSIYEARLFVRGKVDSLGADCIEKEMRAEHLEMLRAAARRRPASTASKPADFQRYGSARKLYNFNVDQRRTHTDGQRPWTLIRNPPTTPRKSATFDDYTLVRNPPRRDDRHL